MVYSKKIDAALEKSPKQQGSGNVSAIEKKIEQRVGGLWVFNYYLFISKYPREPMDIEDFFMGLESLAIMKEMEGPKWA